MTKEEIAALSAAYDQAAYGTEAPTLMWFWASRDELGAEFGRLTGQGKHEAARPIKVILDAMDAPQKS